MATDRNPGRTAGEAALEPAPQWHPELDVTPTPAEVDSMAAVLEGQHGVFATNVAEFFSTKHSIAGDAGRCWAWAGVAERIRMRARRRLNGEAI